MIGCLFKEHQICAGWYRRCSDGLAVTVDTNLLEVTRMPLSPDVIAM